MLKINKKTIYDYMKYDLQFYWQYKYILNGDNQWFNIETRFVVKWNFSFRFIFFLGCKLFNGWMSFEEFEVRKSSNTWRMDTKLTLNNYDI